MSEKYPLPWSFTTSTVSGETFHQIQDASGIIILETDHDTAVQIVEAVNSTLEQKLTALADMVRSLREENGRIVAETAKDKEITKAQYNHLRECYGAYQMGVRDSSGINNT